MYETVSFTGTYLFNIFLYMYIKKNHKAVFITCLNTVQVGRKRERQKKRNFTLQFPLSLLQKKTVKPVGFVPVSTDQFKYTVLLLEDSTITSGILKSVKSTMIRKLI